MNILFISSQPFPYGMAASKRIRLFAEYLAINNDVKVIVAGRNNGSNEEDGFCNGVKWEFIRSNRLQLILSWFKKKSLLKNTFNAEFTNVIMLYDGIGLTNVLFAIIGRKLGYLIFTDVVEDYSLTNEKESTARQILLCLNKYFDKRIKYFVDGIIVISKRLQNKYLGLGLNKKTITLIPVSAENLLFDFKKNISPEKHRFIYSGSYGIKDGVDTLINAFLEVSKLYPSIELFLAGKISDSINELIKDTPRIKYIGLIPEGEYYQFLKNADVLMMTRIDSPYANSGFPFKLGEYLATGNPVIATDVSDVSIYLEDKKDIILAKPSDEMSIMKSMRFVIENENEVAIIGVNGYKKCMTYFNPTTNGKKLESFLNKCLNLF